MTKRAKRGRGPAPRRGGAPAKRSRVPVAVGLAVLVALALGFGIWRRTKGGGGGAGISLNAMSDSLTAAEARKDWVACLAWAQRLVDARPRDAIALRNLSAAWHNFATLERATPQGPRPASRNSIERAGCEIRALALADSAASVALSTGEWVEAELWRGQMIENMGLPIDALDVYRGVLERVPGNRAARVRLIWQITHMRDPQAPDRMQVDPDSLFTP